MIVRPSHVYRGYIAVNVGECLTPRAARRLAARIVAVAERVEKKAKPKARKRP